ncbi:MAG: hypothetical protein WC527_02330 [Candidatus Margulisiibacteriota bacterium]
MRIAAPKNLNMVALGGASTYFPDFILHYALSPILRERVGKIVLYDKEPERVEIVGRFSRRVLADHGLDPSIISVSTDKEKAFEGAHIFLNMMRAGKMPGRLEDETLPLLYGLIGQETMGLGGLRLLSRQIHALQELIPAIKSNAAKDPYFFNFANPAGLLSMAVGQMTNFNTVLGLCNIPFEIRIQIARALKIQRSSLSGQTDEQIADRIQIDSIGLNHLSFFRHFIFDGEDITAEVIKFISNPPANFDIEKTEDIAFYVDIVKEHGLFPNWYWQYRMNHADVVEKQKATAISDFRAFKVMQWERNQLDAYANPNSPISETLFELVKRGGAGYALMATRALAAILTDSKDRQIVSTKNSDSDGKVFIPWLPKDIFVEVPCFMHRTGPRFDKKMDSSLPEPFRSSVIQEADAGIYFVNGLLQNDPDLVLKAVWLHPLIGRRLPQANADRFLHEILKMFVAN